MLTPVKDAAMEGERRKARQLDRWGQLMCFGGTVVFCVVAVLYREPLAADSTGLSWPLEVPLLFALAAVLVVAAFVRWYWFGQTVRKPIRVRPINAVLEEDESEDIH